jgi:hypothetical protein
MAKILINEQHIRKIVKETLENLLLGEDEIGEFVQDGMTLSDCINALSTQKILNKSITVFNDSECTIEISYNDVEVQIDCIYDGKYIPSDKGDYWTPPSGDDYELYELYPIHILFQGGSNEAEFDVQKGTPEFEYLYKLLDDFVSDLEDKVMEYLYDNAYEEDYNNY